MEKLIQDLTQIKGVASAKFMDATYIEKGRKGDIVKTTRKDFDITLVHSYSIRQLRRIVRDVMQVLGIHTFKKRMGGINGEIIVFDAEKEGIDYTIWGYTNSKRRIGILSKAFNCQITMKQEPRSFTSTSYVCAVKKTTE